VVNTGNFRYGDTHAEHRNGLKMTLDQRLQRERLHGREIIATEERNWGWSTPAGQIRWKRRLDFLAHGAEPDSKVLEIGAGSGTFTAELSNHYSELTAIDISPDLLAVAAKRAPRAVLACMDAHNLEFPDNTFDAIVGCSVLHHLDWAAALQNFIRKLKPGGVIRFSEPNLLNPQIFLQKSIPWLKRMAGDSPDEYAFTARRISQDLRNAGYTDIQVTPYEFLHPSTPPAFIPIVLRLEKGLELPVIRHIGGSLRVQASKPAGTP
jgi:demethylmenaquinone methyltransferase/2-methoxy-6-polyprenyl-1,4-benzoquinol methylase